MSARIRLRSPGAHVSFQVGVRSAVACAALFVLITLVAVVSLGTGEYAVAPRRVVEVLLGGGSDAERLVVTEWRAPRVLLALLAGAALGASGAIFQSMTRNPLGSPDVIGFSNGAFAGAVVAIVLWEGSVIGTPVAALVGGVLTALVVYLLAYRRGFHGFRLIIVGIAVGQVLSSATTWWMVRADLDLAMSAAVWGTGSLSGATWGEVARVAVVLAALLPALAVAGPTLRALELGDESAAALGIRLRWSTLWLSVVGVALIAIVTAYCGLITFVALAAPQLGLRLTRAPGVPLVPAALVGALLLGTSDWVAQHALGGRELPVGVVTVSIGGCYLVWLLVREARHLR